MADSTCGPSNAFKGLARHIEQDRSHQQDRVAPGPQQPAQSFRSAPLISGGLTSQFNAFQQQNVMLPGMPPAGLEHLSTPPGQLNHAAHSWGVGPLSGFSPLQQQQQQPLPGMAQGADANWVNDFQRMNFSNAHTRPLQSHQPQAPVMGHPGLMNSMHPDFNVHPDFVPFQQEDIFRLAREMDALQSMDAGAVSSETNNELEREFEAAMDEWMLQNGPEAEASAQNQNLDQHNDHVLGGLESFPSPELTATEVTKDDPVEAQETNTELARAAQLLVDSVADNDSDKFKNSAFLALMRRIATHQLTVQGNEFVEAPRPPSMEAGSTSHVTVETSTGTLSDTNHSGQ